MTSSPNAKPLNPEAQPFRARHYLKLPYEFYHRRSLPLPPPPPVEQWHAGLHMPYYSVPLYHQNHLGLYFKHPPALGRCYVRYYQQPSLLHAFGGGRAFGVADLCGDGGGAEVAENKLVVKRKEVGVMERIRRTRKGPWRRVSRPSVWRPKSKYSKSSGGGGVATVHPSYPPPPPPPPPPPQSQFDDVSCCGRTTIMIKNIPNQYRRNMLLDFLDKHCQEHNQKAKLQSDPLHLAYDFVYLPMDFRSGYNLGYAFVNFTSSGAAFKIAEMINHFKWGIFKTSDAKVYESKKICEITWAKIQGKDGLVKHFKNSTFTCANVEYLPVVLSPPRNGSTTLSLPNPVAKCLA